MMEGGERTAKRQTTERRDDGTEEETSETENKIRMTVTRRENKRRTA